MYREPVRRRQHPRVPAGFQVRLHADGAPSAPLIARDLSLTGLLVEGDLKECGSRVVLQLELPAEQRHVVVTAHIVRDDASGTAALHFLDLDWDDMFALARFLAPRLP